MVLLGVFWLVSFLAGLFTIWRRDDFFGRILDRVFGWNQLLCSRFGAALVCGRYAMRRENWAESEEELDKRLAIEKAKEKGFWFGYGDPKGEKPDMCPYMDIAKIRAYTVGVALGRRTALELGDVKDNDCDGDIDKPENRKGRKSE